MPGKRGEAMRSCVKLLPMTFALMAPGHPASAARQPVELPAEIDYPELGAFDIPEPERARLKNGLTILMLPSHELPLVEGLVLIHTGGRLEPEDKLGLASLTGAVMRTGGTSRHSGDEIDDRLAGIGAVLETSIGEAQGQARFSCLRQDLDGVLDLLAEILRHPAFAEDKLQVAKTQTRAAIARRNDDPQDIAFREFAKLVYGEDSVYARHPEYQTIAAVTRDDLVDFHARSFHPNRVLMGLTGDFKPRELVRLIEKHFGDWKKGPAAKPFQGGYQSRSTAGIYLVEKSDVNQTNVVLGHQGIQRDDPDFFAVQVLNEIFGGGMSSRLFSRVRSQKGLAYAVWGGIGSAYDHPGVFRVFMSTKSGSTLAGMQALVEEVEAMRAEPPTAEEMERAKSSILNSFIFNFDTLDEILARQLTYEYYGYPLDFLERYRGEIAKVSAADVERVATKFMHPQRLARLVVGKSGDFEEPLSSLGRVSELDVSIPPPPGEERPEATAKDLERGRNVVSAAVERLGGRETLAAIERLRTRGALLSMTPMGEVSMATSSLVQLPDTIREEMTTPMGQVVIEITAEGARMSTPMGERELPEAERRSQLEDLQRGLHVLLGRSDLEAQHLGQEQVGGITADKLAVSAGDVELTLWVGPQGRILADSYSGAGPGGAPGLIRREYADWRPVGATSWPFEVKLSFDGEPFARLELEEVEVNPEAAE